MPVGNRLAKSSAARVVAARNRQRLVVVRNCRQLRRDARTARQRTSWSLATALTRANRFGHMPTRPASTRPTSRAVSAISALGRRRRLTTSESSLKAAPALSTASTRRTGNKIWSHDTSTEFGVTVTTWGKSGSPLVVDDMVLISVGAPTARQRFAWPAGTQPNDPATTARWWPSTSKLATSAGPPAPAPPPTLRRLSPTLAGERQIVVVNESWVTAHRVSDGDVLWEHPWGQEIDTTASARSRYRSTATDCSCRRATASAVRCWRSAGRGRHVFARPAVDTADQERDENQVL